MFFRRLLEHRLQSEDQPHRLLLVLGLEYRDLSIVLKLEQVSVDPCSFNMGISPFPSFELSPPIFVPPLSFQDNEYIIETCLLSGSNLLKVSVVRDTCDEIEELLPVSTG